MVRGLRRWHGTIFQHNYRWRAAKFTGGLYRLAGDRLPDEFSREINLGLAQHEFELFCQPCLMRAASNVLV